MKFFILLIIVSACTISPKFPPSLSQKKITAMIKNDKSLTNGSPFFMVSYYADKFEGKKTSNGEVFSQNKKTCAHKTLPFGTKIKLTNETNNKSVIVRVNDRGPFHKGRDLDVSYSVAKELDFISNGIMKLRYELIKN